DVKQKPRFASDTLPGVIDYALSTSLNKTLALLIEKSFCLYYSTTRDSLLTSRLILSAPCFNTTLIFV
ncbi:hypothetical protein, partial [Pantoea septica]|uniref:hypothetical protein n=1 Tax=Pantoea septica TaxID=472695 RepID=UPI0028990329